MVSGPASVQLARQADPVDLALLKLERALHRLPATLDRWRALVPLLLLLTHTSQRLWLRFRTSRVARCPAVTMRNELGGNVFGQLESLSRRRRSCQAPVTGRPLTCY